MSEQSAEEQTLYFNGIDGESGDYEIPPLSGGQFSAIITKAEQPENLAELKYWHDLKTRMVFGVEEGIDANNLGESGWGVIFPTDADPQVVEALQPLLTLRKTQASDPYFYNFSGPDGYRPGMNKTDFLARHGAGPGPANPAKVPYYLLLVGDPGQIPFQFQTQLDVQYAVGRIAFKTPQEYANYAASVVAAEKGQVKLPRQAAFFGVHNADDPATALSDIDLVQPLVQSLAPKLADWQFNSYLAEQAVHTRLDTLLGGDPAQTPALLFSASHGMGFPNGSARQLPHQGALLCQDWPGPKDWRQAIPPDFYFAGDHLPSDRNLLGMIAFLFACYGAGTPQIDQFSKQYSKDRAAIAPYSFLAGLPMKMLGLSRGGALAVIGHVERAWGTSFKWTKEGQQAESFESALLALFSGKTVGMAVEYFNERYAEIATVLSDKLEDIEANMTYDPNELAKMWTANNDARGYAILGDPAVRLPVVEQGLDGVRPQTEPVVLISPAANPQPGPVKPAAPQTTVPPVIAVHSTIINPKEKKKMDASTPFSPPPAEPEGLNPALKQDLNKAYVKHVKDGYSNTDAVFKLIMRAFLISHYSTVVMYWLLFAIGVVLLVVGLRSQNIWAAIVSGFGVTGFVAYFITRSVTSVELNLIYITWLGVIYNTYWVHQQYSRDPEKAQQELNKASNDAINQVKGLLDRYDQSLKRRPNLKTAAPSPTPLEADK